MINEEIQASKVRVVAPDGEQIGIKSVAEALAIARGLDLDLVEVAPGANPPVCRIMNYGKYKYGAAQRAKESRRKSAHSGLKEMKYRPKIGKGDFDTKTTKVHSFLTEGHKVKVTIMFRGREVFHPELGREILERVVDFILDIGKVDQFPKLDGRNMTMVLSPDRQSGRQSGRKKRSLAELKAAADAEKTGDAEPAAETASAPAAAEPAGAPAAEKAAATPTDSPTGAPTGAVRDSTSDNGTPSDNSPSNADTDAAATAEI